MTFFIPGSTPGTEAVQNYNDIIFGLDHSEVSQPLWMSRMLRIEPEDVLKLMSGPESDVRA